MDIHELRKQPHLSASAINDYLSCGFLFKLRRIDKVEREFISDALEFGSVIHEVLAEFYQEKMEGRKMSLKKLLSLFTSCWKEAAKDSEEIEYAEGNDFKVMLEKGKSLLKTYYESISDDRFRVVGIEEPFQFFVQDVPMIGVIDLLEEDEGGNVIITDFKTSGRAYSEDEVHKNLQLTIYHMALKANGYAGHEILLKLDCLIKTKTPRFEQYYTSRSEIDERRVTKKIIQVWEGIQKEVFIPNDGNWRCKGCDLKSYCDEYLES